jgi:predicted nucleotidyltransferase component of viral defense system
MNENYIKQVQLLLRVLPLIETEKCFALKGGTAINLFYRNLPRLSVDIDLLYIPMDDREEALKNIRDALTRLSDLIRKTIKGAKVQNVHEQSDTLRVIVQLEETRIKVELSRLSGVLYFRRSPCRYVKRLKLSMAMLKCNWHRFPIYLQENYVRL